MKKILQYTFFVSLLLSCELPNDNMDRESSDSNPTSASLSATITFAKHYGGTGTEEHTRAVIQTSDGGYALIGLFSGGSDSFYFAKTDRYGNLLWYNTYGGELGDGNGGQDLRQTPDGGYILIGNTELEPWVFKTDKYGAVQWDWRGPRVNQARSIALSADNGYVGVGSTIDTTSSRISVFKLSSSGNLLWTRTCLPENNAYGASIERTSDNGFIVAGTASTDEGGDICLLKIDSEGNLQWSTFWGGSYSDEGNHAIQTADGGYAVIGTDGKENNSQIYLIKTDSQGRYKWVKGYFPSVNAVGNSVVQTSDRGFAIAGAAYNNNILIKVSSNGAHQWNKTFSSTALNWAEDVIATSDGGYSLTGLLNDPSIGWKGSLVKTDRYGNY